METSPDRDSRSHRCLNQQWHVPGHVPVCFSGTLVCLHLCLCLASCGICTSPLPPWKLSQKQVSRPSQLLSHLLYLESRPWKGVGTLSVGRAWPPMRQAVPSPLTCGLGVWERWEGLARPEVGQKAGMQETGGWESSLKLCQRPCLRKPTVTSWAKG